MVKYFVMEKSERHQIKRNEILVLLEKGYDLILKYKKEILYFFLIIVAISLIVWGFISYKNLRERHAGMLLSQALSEDNINYEKLKSIATKYKGTLAGKEADLLIEIKDGKDPQRILKKIDNLLGKIKEPIMRGILITNKIEININLKRYEDALKFLKDEKDSISEDFYLFLNAKIMEYEGKTEEAKAQYQRLINEFQDSNLRYLAQQRMNVL